jgi:hypothetical protein
MTPQQKLEYVEERWPASRLRVSHEADGYAVYLWEGIGPSIGVFRCASEKEAVHAAFLFTKKRNRQIAEVEAEIAEAKPWAESTYARAAVRRVRERILVSRQAALAELKRGFREVPR